MLAEGMSSVLDPTDGAEQARSLLNIVAGAGGRWVGVGSRLYFPSQAAIPERASQQGRRRGKRGGVVPVCAMQSNV